MERRPVIPAKAGSPYFSILLTPYFCYPSLLLAEANDFIAPNGSL
jgi:hypothetical protein